MALPLLRRNQRSCERFPTWNAIHYIVKRLVTAPLPLKMPVDRDRINSTDTASSVDIYIVTDHVECVGVRPCGSSGYHALGRCVGNGERT
ncbi:hypothetical protein R70199_02384 [Paraburkholderia domus]|nr:hypothetical protein R70199_02384 [Paraburkholderia domus]